MNVLIAHASTRGSTRAIAHRIAGRPRGRGPHACVGPMAEIRAWADTVPAQPVPQAPASGDTP